MKNKKNSNKLIFLIFNTACLGDNLLCNALCQKIKIYYPNSKIVFICDKPYVEANLYQKDVDEVIIFDKHGKHKNIRGIINFIKTFPYKNAQVAFITYKNFRNHLVAKLLGTKRVFESKKFVENISIQQQILNLLEKFIGEKQENIPIKYEAPCLSDKLTNIFEEKNKYIALCTLTKNPIKNIPLETAINIIKKLQCDYKIIFTGTGIECIEYSKNLEKAGCQFINLVNKTTISELAGILKKCKALITADTGTMHLACAVGTPTIPVFYENYAISRWSPNSKLYKTLQVCSLQSAENIVSALTNLIYPKTNILKKISVIIPTLQKNIQLLTNLLTTLEEDESVDEIIVIDNSLKGLEYHSEKLQIIIPKTNIYVNPSWNIGVKKAKNNIVAILNDDITITNNFCSQIVKILSPQMGCAGACYKDLKETKNIEYKIISGTPTLVPINLITHHWGVAIFCYKSSYFEIPNDMKVFRGDDWLFYQNKLIGRQNYYITGQKIFHYGSLSSKSKSIKSIGQKDRKNYRKYMGKKWYQFFYDVDELFDAYRLTIFGFKVIIKKEKNGNEN